MQHALEQASAAIDAAVNEYAAQIAVMEQEVAAKQAEMVAMSASLIQHKARYTSLAQPRGSSQMAAIPDKHAPADAPAAQPLLTETQWPPVSLSPGSPLDPLGDVAKLDDSATRMNRPSMQQSSQPFPFPFSALPGAGDPQTARGPAP